MKNFLPYLPHHITLRSCVKSDKRLKRFMGAGNDIP